MHRLAMLLVVVGCTDPPDFVCSDDSQCVDGSIAGRCELDGHCSFPDSSCTSGFRYAELSGPQSDACVVRCVEDVSLGETHGCVVRSDGRMVCWGDRSTSLRWQGYPASAGERPHLVSQLEQIKQIASGPSHVCVIVGDQRQVHCWGSAEGGKLGNSSGVLDPVKVGGSVVALKDVVAGTNHTCGRPQGTEVKVACWGCNDEGQLGVPADGNCVASENVIDLFEAANSERVIGIAGGGDVGCTWSQSGVLACWGGVPATICPDAPIANTSVRICTPTLVTEVGISSAGGCSISNGVVACVNGNITSDIPQVSQLGVGRSHACALGGGQVWCGGNNARGQLGRGVLGDASEILPFEPVAGLPEVDSVAVGQDFSCAVAVDGELFCWGDNSGGQVIPDSAESAVPAPTNAVSRAIACPTSAE